jgi:hypothetical protein
MNEKNIQLTFSLEEVNMILTSLGNLPYGQVYNLIQEIQNQTEKQLEEIQSILTDHTN